MSASHFHQPPSERMIGFQKLCEEAVIPRRGSAGAVGYDISSVADEVIPPNKRAIIPTGIRLVIPAGHYIRVAPRSGLAAKKGISILAGVIDPDYTGEVKVILMNHGDEEFVIRSGDRIAQLVLERCSTPLSYEIPMEREVQETERGANGFGSTGV